MNNLIRLFKKTRRSSADHSTLVEGVQRPLR
jgi:hypothetical protein